MGRIRIENLSRKFADFTAVDNIDLDIRDGDFLVLLGPSGCGKTTLLRMLAGLLEPTSGRILLDDDDITTAPARRRDVAMVFQSYALYPHLSVAKNLAFPLRVKKMRKSEAAERIEAVAQQLDIAHLLGRKPKELSGGQRQRVAVGRAIVRNPKAFLMDEPLSNLDAKLRTATRRELTELHRRLGATFVYVTHDQVEAMTMATRIALLNNGALEQVGTPEDVYDRPASVFVAGFLGSPAMNLLDARVHTVDGTVVASGEGVTARLWRGQADGRDVVLGIRPEHLRVVEPADHPGVRLSVGVTSVENLGSEQVAYCEVGGATVCVRAPRPIALRADRSAVLTADLTHVHLFDRATGRRLEWVDVPELTDFDSAAPTAVDQSSEVLSATGAT
ncbi:MULTISPECIES: ABC transporter ATP-binding protein [Rhodococcus]|uniref:Trehalose import ATP-binding protein SugC n=1 Tax=Rhodococcus oxybenzonivorans TaxID=1990687 RepID=A0AAE5A653_9NOCA|nr:MULTISPECIES: ABC transporter ATP-binding protein [Rhodococcus]MDV7242851.1 ABC transporter ATP-binding protein [Rhodococcus oxybenzonivorans]MDV7265550.1 ABC transporter ATP-binding protein [Rhodococcus oxybenzonivorans]MDV7275255.1 ABC transporter ATP-binding protein [Rhodococcus oxybenzonivorans]MDV7334890.1 ABC transporter ATP-binding protein [Rhodococcus oxybenzonivorans]MDV7345044.1 ABC transporter ATP-binding protein [Rhodococcus oxybenzonivorans]